MSIRKSKKHLLAGIVLIIVLIACSTFTDQIADTAVPENDVEQSTQTASQATVAPVSETNSVATSQNGFMEFVMEIPSSTLDAYSDYLNERLYVFDPLGRYLFVYDDHNGISAKDHFLTIDLQTKSIDDFSFNEDLYEPFSFFKIKISSDGKYIVLTDETATWGKALIIDTDTRDVTEIELYTATIDDKIFFNPEGSGWLPGTYSLYVPDKAANFILFDPFTDERKTVNLNLPNHQAAYVKWNYDETRAAFEFSEKIMIFDKAFSFVTEFGLPEKYVGGDPFYWYGKDKLLIARELIVNADGVPSTQSKYYVLDSKNGNVVSQFTLDAKDICNLTPNPGYELIVGSCLHLENGQSLDILNTRGELLERMSINRGASGIQWNRSGDFLAFLDNESVIHLWRLK